MSSNKSDNMTAVPKSIEGILSDNPKMKIPVFQRDYSWKVENWKELWNDIKIGFENNSKHYLGSVVLVNNDEFKEVVDGQQRLTTISIIFLAIISNFNDLIANNIDKEQNIRRAEDIKSLICERDLYDMSLTNKLKLNENNNTIYAQYLVETNVPDDDVVLSQSNKLLVDCFNYYKKQFKKACTDDGENHQNFRKLLDYFTYISKNLLLIEIIASDYQNAYVIFETLNDRGLDLTVTDLLKNYLFSMVNYDRHEEIKRYWNEIINRVEEKNATKFIRHYWNSFNKKVTEKELFKAIKDKIKDQSSVILFLQRLRTMSEIYSALSDPKNSLWNGDEKIVAALEEIRLYKVDLCFPVLLAAHSNISNLDKKRKIFRLCSVISFRYIIVCNGSANDLENAYNNLCLYIHENKNDIDINKISKEMREFLVSSDEFIASFKNKVIKTKNNKKIITYILKNIERNRRSNITEDYTIEHILPEKYDEEWDVIFKQEASDYIYRLGNYILLEKELNSEIGNSCFDDKKEKYNESIYNGAKKISQLERWSIKELEKHQEEMAIIMQTVISF